MSTIYVENPHNFAQIEPYVIIDKVQIVQELIIASKCYIYDACSFRRHIQITNSQELFSYFKSQEGIIVITRCILMELASHSGILNREYVQYIKDMHAAGLKILILYEEDLYEVLSACFSTNVEINKCLAWAVKTVKTPTSTIESTLKANKALLGDVISGNTTDGSFFTRFFQAVRNNKVSEDNLGEQLIAICVHVLANVPESCEYKYVVMTDDKGAIGLIKKATKNIIEHKQVKAFSAMTTTKMVQQMYELSIITDKDRIEEILFIGSSEDTLKFIGSEKYDLDSEEKKMTYSELAEKIMSKEIHINY